MATQTVNVECRKCQKQFVASIPEAIVVNTPAVSQVLWMHPRGDRCPHCLTWHVPVIMGLKDIAWDFRPIAGPTQSGDGSGIILPPTGMKV